MRLWSLHPKYLDTKGLLALWREGLLAKKVLEGKTEGYTKHPQLLRFRQHPLVQEAINYYLLEVWREACRRRYRFDQTKITLSKTEITKIKVTEGQIDFEKQHLSQKLKARNQLQYRVLRKQAEVEVHPLFTVIPGLIEPWEKLSS